MHTENKRQHVKLLKCGTPGNYTGKNSSLGNRKTLPERESASIPKLSTAITP